MSAAGTRARNLLFLWTDEQRADSLGATGTSWARTPNLDRLARTGAVFEQAYCAQPVCTPSRATVVTGTYPHTHGSVYNNIPLTEAVPTVAEVLRREGYVCGYAGKWHLGREVHPQRGFDAFWSSMEDGYVKDHAREGFSTYHHWLVAQGYQPPDAGKDGSRVFSRGTAARLPEGHGKPAFLAEQACRFLDTYGHQPFALYVNFLEPHMPFFGPWDGMYDPEQMGLPETWYGEPDPGVPLRHRLRRDWYEGANAHVRTPDERGWRELRARYWGLVSLVDKYCGVILDRLDELGLAQDTAVVYSSDHGDMMGEHRLIAKGVPYEGAARVPLIVRLPGVLARRITTPVSQVDLLPTLLDALDVDAPGHLQGESLLPLIRDGDTQPDEAEVVVEWSGAANGETADGHKLHGGEQELAALSAQQRTIRRGRWKLTVDELGGHELYDLSADPHETRNLLFQDRLTEAPGARAAAEELWRRLQAWQERTADRLRLPAPVT